MKVVLRLAPILFVTLPSIAAQAQSNDSIEQPASISEQESTQGDAPAQAAESSSVDSNSGGQTAASHSEQSSAGSRLLEEVVVTAQKREEKLMDVPISVQAFSSEALDARGITDQSGLMKATPGLDIGSQAGFTSIFLRGIGTEAWLTADTSVASYIDGVYYPFAPSIIQEFGAVERVEVLKGPQGTLFGRNAVGGAINVITKSPSFADHSTSVQLNYEDYATTRARLYTNVPVTDTLAFNISGFYNIWDSYLKGSTSAGMPLSRELASGVRTKLRWMPLDELEVQLSLVNSHSQSNGALPLNRNPSLLGRTLGVQPAGAYTTHVDERLYLNMDTRVLAGQAVYNAPWFDVKVLGSKQHNSQPYNYDFDGSDKPLVSFDIPVHYADIEEGELQLLSNQSTPGSDWLTITAGMFYFKNEQGFDPIRVTVANLDPTRLQSLGINVPAPLQSALNGVFGAGGTLQNLFGSLGLPLPLPNDPLYTVTDTALVKTNSLSEYLQVTAKVADWISLTLGGRYQNEERGVLRSDTRLQLLGQTEVGLIHWQEARDGNGNPVPLNHTTAGFKPKVSIDTHPFGDDTLVYATYQQAVKAHAYNAYAIYLPPAYVKPEETTAYEIGAKTTVFDGTTRISAAAFLYKIKDLQSQFVSLINGGAVSFENAGNAQSKGFDFDITSELFPSLINGLAMTLNGCYLNAHYTSYKNGSGYNKTTGIFSNDNDYTGNEITRSPTFSGAVVLTKTWFIPGGPLEVGADYYYNSGFWYTASNDPNFEQPSYSLLGAHLSYMYSPWNVRATLFGKNLTNTNYTTGIIATDFGSNYSVAAPIQYGLKLNWDF